MLKSHDPVCYLFFRMDGNPGIISNKGYYEVSMNFNGVIRKIMVPLADNFFSENVSSSNQSANFSTSNINTATPSKRDETNIERIDLTEGDDKAITSDEIRNSKNNKINKSPQVIASVSIVANEKTSVQNDSNTQKTPEKLRKSPRKDVTRSLSKTSLLRSSQANYGSDLEKTLRQINRMADELLQEKRKTVEQRTNKQQALDQQLKNSFRKTAMQRQHEKKKQFPKLSAILIEDTLPLVDAVEGSSSLHDIHTSNGEQTAVYSKDSDTSSQSTSNGEVLVISDTIESNAKNCETDSKPDSPKKTPVSAGNNELSNSNTSVKELQSDKMTIRLAGKRGRPRGRPRIDQKANPTERKGRPTKIGSILNKDVTKDRVRELLKQKNNVDNSQFKGGQVAVQTQQGIQILPISNLQNLSSTTQYSQPIQNSNPTVIGNVGGISSVMEGSNPIVLPSEVVTPLYAPNAQPVVSNPSTVNTGSGNNNLTPIIAAGAQVVNISSGTLAMPENPVVMQGNGANLSSVIGQTALINTAKGNVVTGNAIQSNVQNVNNFSQLKEILQTLGQNNGEIVTYDINKGTDTTQKSATSHLNNIALPFAGVQMFKNHTAISANDGKQPIQTVGAALHNGGLNQTGVHNIEVQNQVHYQGSQILMNPNNANGNLNQPVLRNMEIQNQASQILLNPNNATTVLNNGISLINCQNSQPANANLMQNTVAPPIINLNTNAAIPLQQQNLISEAITSTQPYIDASRYNFNAVGYNQGSDNNTLFGLKSVTDNSHPTSSITVPTVINSQQNATQSSASVCVQNSKVTLADGKQGLVVGQLYIDGKIHFLAKTDIGIILVASDTLKNTSSENTNAVESETMLPHVNSPQKEGKPNYQQNPGVSVQNSKVTLADGKQGFVVAQLNFDGKIHFLTKTDIGYILVASDTLKNTSSKNTNGGEIQTTLPHISPQKARPNTANAFSQNETLGFNGVTLQTGIDLINKEKYKQSMPKPKKKRSDKPAGVGDIVELGNGESGTVVAQCILNGTYHFIVLLDNCIIMVPRTSVKKIGHEKVKSTQSSDIVVSEKNSPQALNCEGNVDMNCEKLPETNQRDSSCSQDSTNDQVSGVQAKNARIEEVSKKSKLPVPRWSKLLPKSDNEHNAKPKLPIPRLSQLLLKSDNECNTTCKGKISQDITETSVTVPSEKQSNEQKQSEEQSSKSSTQCSKDESVENENLNESIKIEHSESFDCDEDWVLPNLNPTKTNDSTATELHSIKLADGTSAEIIAKVEMNGVENYLTKANNILVAVPANTVLDGRVVSVKTATDITGKVHDNVLKVNESSQLKTKIIYTQYPRKRKHACIAADSSMSSCTIPCNVVMERLQLGDSPNKKRFSASDELYKKMFHKKSYEVPKMCGKLINFSVVHIPYK